MDMMMQGGMSMMMFVIWAFWLLVLVAPRDRARERQRASPPRSVPGGTLPLAGSRPYAWLATGPRGLGPGLARRRRDARARWPTDFDVVDASTEGM